MQVHQELLEQHPEFRVQLGLLETQTRSRLANARTSQEPVSIAVVVHVVYHDPQDNIDKAQIDSQIDALNRDYGASNNDKGSVPTVWSGLVANPQITFVLATRDPQGGATDGVTRTQTATASFGTDDTVKSAATGGVDPWPTDQYLNIWVCALGGGILGYAQFPSGPPQTDGVVILNSAFGTNGTATAPFNLGRTSTHEIGHFLNLHHIWGDTVDCTGTDFVADTPPAQHPNYGKPQFPHVSCTNGPNGDMFMNYMDYVDDDVMVMFTPGQVARIRATLAGPRAQLVAHAIQLTA